MFQVHLEQGFCSTSIGCVSPLFAVQVVGFIERRCHDTRVGNHGTVRVIHEYNAMYMLI
jgi:hypothetical protein